MKSQESVNTDFSNIRCIAFDLDYTILTTGKAVTARTQAALKRASDKGIALLPASGRPISSFPFEVRHLEGADYAVTSDGAAVYDLRSGERIREWLLDADDIRAVMRDTESFFKDRQITYEAFVDGEGFADADYIKDPVAFGADQSAVPYIQRNRRAVQSITDFIAGHIDGMENLNLIVKDPELCRRLERIIPDGTENIHLTSSSSYRIEITGTESGKVSGIKYALGLLRIGMDETIAFGDGDNDAGMLAAAGVGVAMINATPSCRESADYMTAFTSDEDGVADFLERLIL